MAMLSDRVLTPTELRAWTVRSDLPIAIRLTGHVLLLALTGWGVEISSGWTTLPAMLALGLVQVAPFTPSHETTFASRRANAIVGRRRRTSISRTGWAICGTATRAGTSTGTMGGRSGTLAAGHAKSGQPRAEQEQRGRLGYSRDRGDAVVVQESDVVGAGGRECVENSD